MEEKIEEALADIMYIVNNVHYSEGSGGLYDGNPEEEIRSILEYLVK